MSVAIHVNPGVEWQAKRARCFSTGLKALGIEHIITPRKMRIADIAILFGTTFWKDIEDDGYWLLVDRASIGDPEYVQLVWNGHGRRGNHMVPDDIDSTRRRALGVELQPWRTGNRVVLCGQTETYSPHYASLNDWYAVVSATHFRGHPAGDNPTGLPQTKDWNDCGLAVTLNSSVAVDAVISGIVTVAMDEGSMAWDVTSKLQNFPSYRDRVSWLDWLSWTQWTWGEIRAGEPIRHLFEAM